MSPSTSSSGSEVLALLRDAKDAPLSGQALSEKLGKSRAQIWKNVEALRKRGYGIEGEPGEGYRLTAAPDRLFAEELLPQLRTRWIAREIEHFDSIDSTNRRAAARAAEGAPAGFAVIAEGQTAGRGRLGRSFFSPPYLNLYTSIVLRPQLTTADAPTLILGAAIAVAEAVAKTVDEPGDVEIKWPNDVLLRGLKTSGILMELNAEATRVEHAVLGIGVNLNVDRETFPDEFRHLATSLSSHCGRKIDRVAFARTLFEHLEQVLDDHQAGGFARLQPRFEKLFRMAGRKIQVTDLAGASTHGTARGIAADGALEIETDLGKVIRVVAGDVTIDKEPSAS